MAGKYNLFLVLWFVVACFAGVSSLTPTPYSNSSTSESTVESPTTGNVSSTAVTTTTPTTGNVSSTAVTTTTSTTGNVSSTAVTTTTSTTGNVSSTAVTTKSPTTGNVSSTAVTTKSPTTGGVSSTAVTTKSPTTGNVSSTAVTTKSPTTGGVSSTAVTMTTPTTGGVSSTAVTTKSPTTGNVSSTAVTTPGSGGTITMPTSPTTATGPPPPTPDACHVNPCGRGSTCAVRANQTFVCLCSLGDSYNYLDKACVNVKVFPGQLSLPNLSYSESMQNKTSPEFKKAAQDITHELSTAFSKEENGFSNVTVLSLQKLAQSRVGSVRPDGVTASIEIIFSTSSNITTDVVTSVMKSAADCGPCVLGGATFNVTDLCAGKPCEENSTTCSSINGDFLCSCNENYIKTEFSNKICLACPNGEKTEDSITCDACPFGYSGWNCTEYWKLALVIVASMLGGLLLIMLILLPVLVLRSQKKGTEKSKHEDIGKPYVSHFPAKAPLANGNGSFANSQAPSYQGSGSEGAGAPRIPRATANSNWDSRTNLEMTSSNSRQNLVPMGSNSRLYDDEDDMNSYTRPQSNLYASARPRGNPYTQSRPQNNPYAPNQGHNNPYYPQNNEKW